MYMEKDAWRRLYTKLFNAVITTLFSQVCCFAILLHSKLYNSTSNHVANLFWTNRPCVLCVARHSNTMWIGQVCHVFSLWKQYCLLGFKPAGDKNRLIAKYLLKLTPTCYTQQTSCITVIIASSSAFLWIFHHYSYLSPSLRKWRHLHVCWSLCMSCRVDRRSM